MNNSGGGGRAGRTSPYAEEYRKAKRAQAEAHRFDGSDPDMEAVEA